MAVGYLEQMVVLEGLPTPLSWRDLPDSDMRLAGRELMIRSAPDSDWFVDPAGGSRRMNASAALFAPPDHAYLLSAHVSVEFGSVYDAGVLVLYSSDDTWAKLCFEYSPQRHPMIVSVVTSGASDDCNSTEIAGSSVWLRICCYGPAFAFHYSLDGEYWNLVRHFRLKGPPQGGGPLLGFLAQSPKGPGCTASFHSISYRRELLRDIRSGV